MCSTRYHGGCFHGVDAARHLHLHDAHAARAHRRALEAATGWNYTVDDSIRFGKRVGAIARATYLRCGWKPELEMPSKRYSSTPVDGPAKGQSIAAGWDKMLDVWYKDVGYDRKTGKPLPETLKGLGLDWLAKDLWGKK